MGFEFYNASKVLLYTGEVERHEVVSLDIHPSGSCTQSCVWCRYPKFNKQLELGPLKPRYPKLRGVRVTGGGEPLLNEGLLSVLPVWKSEGLEIGLETNGSLVNKPMAEAIAQNCRYCRLSLDASTPETYHRLHRGGDWDTTMKALHLLKDAGVRELGISYLVVEDNIAEIPKLLDLPVMPSYFHFKPLIGNAPLPVSVRGGCIIRDELVPRTIIPIKYDRLLAELYSLPSIPCYMSQTIRVLGADGNEYVCCEHAYEEEFFATSWNGDTSKCTTCRYAKYNKLLHLYNTGELSEGLL